MLVRHWLALATMAVGFVVLGEGCAALIVHHERSKALDSVPVVLLGTPRGEVEATLGKPVSSRSLPDGGHLATYEYTLRADSKNHPVALAVGSVITLGIVEIAWVPMAIYEARKNRRAVTFTYTPDDRVLDHGRPPRYGPPDAAANAPSDGDIRGACRAEHPGGTVHELPFRDYRYRKCVLLRLAIWGFD